MARVFLPFVTNWANGVRDTYEFKTDIFTARDGSEQRRAERIEPRRALTVSILLDDDRNRQFHMAMNRARTGEVEIPDYSADRAFVQSASVASGVTVITLDRVPSWLRSSSRFAVMTEDRRSVLAQALGLTGRVVTVSGEIVGSAMVLPLIPAGFAPSTALTQIAGPDINTVSTTFAVEPGAAQRVPLPLDEGQPGGAAIFYGRYVLTRKPNLLQQPNLTYNLPVKTVDYGRGVVKKFAPVPITKRTLTATWVGRTRADIMSLLDVFLRCKGRAGEIYIPTWGDDFLPIYQRSGTSLIMLGTDFADTYAGDRAHKAVLFTLKNGDTVPREIVNISESGGNSVVRFEAQPPAANDIERVSWMFVSRFAQDSLTLEWLTDEVANVAMSFITLENLPVEDAYGSNWILETGYWRDTGQWVDSDVWKDG